jgi:Fe-S cluster assembly iron-binding protein IscA
MLNVTDAAVEQLSEMLEHTEADGAQCVRLVANQGELELQVDTPREGDQVVAADERPVLLVDADLWSALDGATLDAVDTSEGKQLTLIGASSGGRGADLQNGAH